MDGARFDALAKTLIAAANRRRTLGGLLGGTLGLLGLADPEEAWSAKSGKCKPKCEKCERCKKGKCRRTNDGEKRCKPGKCKPKRGLEECEQGEVRNPDTCDCCLTNGQTCTPPGVNPDCCSGACAFFGPGTDNLCVGLNPGIACSFDEQCLSGDCDNGFCD